MVIKFWVELKSRSYLETGWACSALSIPGADFEKVVISRTGELKSRDYFKFDGGNLYYINRPDQIPDVVVLVTIDKTLIKLDTVILVALIALAGSLVTSYVTYLVGKEKGASSVVVYADKGPPERADSGSIAASSGSASVVATSAETGPEGGSINDAAADARAYPPPPRKRLKTATWSFEVKQADTWYNHVTADAGDVALTLTKVDPAKEGFHVRLYDAADPNRKADSDVSINQVAVFHMTHPGIVNFTLFHYGDKVPADVTINVVYNEP